MDKLELLDLSPLIPSTSPRFGGPLNLTLTVTPDIANGEIGFISNTKIVLYEPEDANISMVRLKALKTILLSFAKSFGTSKGDCLVFSLQVSLPLRRDGTDGQAEVFWSLQPIGANRDDVTADDLQPLSGSVVFLSGQSDASINLTVIADNIPEVNETLLLTLDR